MSYYIKTDSGLLEALSWNRDPKHSPHKQPLLPWADPNTLDDEVHTTLLLESPLRIAKAYSVVDGEHVVCQFSVDTCLPDGAGHFLIQGRATVLPPAMICSQTDPRSVEAAQPHQP
jgi:hypothetical protein